MTNGVTQPLERRTVSVPQAAEMLGVGTSTMWNAVWRGHVKVLRIGRRVLVPMAEINRLLGVETAGKAAER